MRNNIPPVEFFVLIVGAFMLIIGGFCGYMIGNIQGMKEERQKAIEQNVAYYEVDPKTGQLEFKYGVR